MMAHILHVHDMLLMQYIIRLAVLISAYANSSVYCTQAHKRTVAFLEVARNLEDDNEQIAINNPMNEKLAGTTSEAYSYLHMLQEHFGERIFQTEKLNVITFRTTARVSTC